MGVRRTVAGALGAALLVPVSACSNDGPAPPPLASPTTTAPSASPTESSPSPSGPPTLPPEAQGTSKAAAIAFVRHWVQVFNYASATGDVATLRSLHSRLCRPCAVITDKIRDVYAKGGYLRSDGWRVLSARYLARQPKRAPVLNVLVDAPREVEVAQEGANPQRFDGGKVLLTFRLDRQSGRWLVTSVEQPT